MATPRRPPQLPLPARKALWDEVWRILLAPCPDEGERAEGERRRPETGPAPRLHRDRGAP